MNNEAYFENIANNILVEINKAEKSILLAIAWISNKKLFNLLVTKSNLGCTVILIVHKDEINKNANINFNLLSNGASKVFMVERMHNKFCIIDFKTVITGSYNWSNNAELNHENIIITKDDFKITQQYFQEFENIINTAKSLNKAEEVFNPIKRIKTRLMTLIKYINTEAAILVEKELKYLQDIEENRDLNEVLEIAKNNNLQFTRSEIENFFLSTGLIHHDDENSEIIKKEIQELQDKLISLECKKMELDKLLSDFQHRHSIELGQIILELLSLKRNLGEGEAVIGDTEENSYKQIVENEEFANSFILTSSEEAILQKKYKKALKLCHPDIVRKEYEEEATKIVDELIKANKRGDIVSVTNILEMLEKGMLGKINDEINSKRNELEYLLNKLKRDIRILEINISEIENSETYIEIISIKNWDEYFFDIRQRLKNEIDALKQTN